MEFIWSKVSNQDFVAIIMDRRVARNFWGQGGICKLRHKFEWIIVVTILMAPRKWKPCMLFFIFSFQSEYTLCSSLNVKERLPRNRRDIWGLSEYRTDKYSQHKSIIWPVWQNDWVFVCELSDCGFEYYCCHIKYCV